MNNDHTYFIHQPTELLYTRLHLALARKAIKHFTIDSNDAYVITHNYGYISAHVQEVNINLDEILSIDFYIRERMLNDYRYYN